MKLTGSVAALLTGLWITVPAAAVTIVRGPYLGRPDDVSIAVVWLSDSATSSDVEYAIEGGEWSSTSEAQAVTRHVVRLAPLVSGAVYQYRVVLDGQPISDTHTFRAPRDPTSLHVRFGVIGDTDGVVEPTQIATDLAGADLDLVLHTGDVVYPSGQESLFDEEFFTPMAPLLATAPVLPTLGNHDVITDRAAAYLDAFVLPVNDATGDSRFYAARQGPVLFVSVDVESSEYGAGSPQYEWLERTLTTSDAPWKFVLLHEPPYCSAESNLSVRLALTPLFERAGVDVVFSGHMHLYERTFPIRNVVRSGPGIVYMTEGGGGATLVTFVRQPFSAFVVARYGYLVVDIEGGVLSLTAHGADGSVFDSMDLSKVLPGQARAAPMRAAPENRPAAPQVSVRP